jgi:hypothetical protein
MCWVGEDAGVAVGTGVAVGIGVAVGVGLDAALVFRIVTDAFGTTGGNRSLIEDSSSQLRILRRDW